MSNANFRTDRNPCFSYNGLPIAVASIQLSMLRESACEIPAAIMREPMPWRRWVGMTDIQFNAECMSQRPEIKIAWWKAGCSPRCGLLIQIARGLYTCSITLSQNSRYSPSGHHEALTFGAPSLNGFSRCTSHCAQPTAFPLASSTTRYQLLEGVAL